MSTKYEQSQTLTNRQIKRITGVKEATFEEMKGILEVAYAEKHTKRWRLAKLSVPDMLLHALEYWRQYITFAELAFRYGVAESTAHDITVWVENELEIVLVDVTESPIERPQKDSGDTTQAISNLS